MSETPSIHPKEIGPDQRQLFTDLVTELTPLLTRERVPIAAYIRALQQVDPSLNLEEAEAMVRRSFQFEDEHLIIEEAESFHRIDNLFIHIRRWLEKGQGTSVHTFSDFEVGQSRLTLSKNYRVDTPGHAEFRQAVHLTDLVGNPLAGSVEEFIRVNDLEQALRLYERYKEEITRLDNRVFTLQGFGEIMAILHGLSGDTLDISRLPDPEVEEILRKHKDSNE